MSNLVLALPEESVAFLRKSLSRLLPPAAYDTVFSRLALDALSRRAEDGRAKTAAHSKALGESHCLLLDAQEGNIRVRSSGRTETGLVIWLEVTVPGTLSRPLCLDPTFLWTDRIATGSVAVGEIGTGTVPTAPAKQNGVRRRVRVLAESEAETLKMLWGRPVHPGTPDAEFTDLTGPARLFPLACIGEEGSWVTLTEQGAVWKDGDVWLGLAGKFPECRLSPGACRFLAWAFGALSVSALAAGENGGSLKGVSGDMTFSAWWGREAPAYKAARVEPETARGFLARTEEKTESVRCSASELSRGLSAAQGHLAGQGAVSIGCYGSAAIAVVAKADRALVLSPEGPAIKEYPEILLSGPAASKLARLLRVYGMMVKDSSAEFLHPALGESLRLDGALTVTAPLARGLRTSFVKRLPSVTLGNWELPHTFALSCHRALDALRLVPGTPGEEVHVSFGKEVRAHASRGATESEALGESTDSTGAKDVALPTAEWDRGISSLKKAKADSVRFALVRVAKGGLFLDVSAWSGKERVSLARLPYAHEAKAPAPLSVPEHMEVMPDTVALTALLRACATPAADALTQVPKGLQLLRHGLVKSGEVFASDRLTAVRATWSKYEGMLPLFVTEMPSALGECLHGQDGGHVFMGGGVVVRTGPEEDLSLFPNVAMLFTKRGEIVLGAKASLPALLEHLPPGAKQWVWHRSGRFSAREGDWGLGEISAWAGEETLCLECLHSLRPALETLKLLFPEELLVDVQVQGGRLTITGSEFSLLCLLSQNPEPDPAVVETAMKGDNNE